MDYNSLYKTNKYLVKFKQCNNSSKKCEYLARMKSYTQQGGAPDFEKLTAVIKELTTHINGNDGIISKFKSVQEEKQELDKTIVENKKKINELNISCNTSGGENTAALAQIAKLKKENEANVGKIRELTEKIALHDDTVKQLNAQVAVLQQTNDDLTAQLTELNATLEEKTKAFDELNREIGTVFNKVMDHYINKINELLDLNNSTDALDVNNYKYDDVASVDAKLSTLNEAITKIQTQLYDEFNENNKKIKQANDNSSSAIELNELLGTISKKYNKLTITKKDVNILTDYFGGVTKIILENDSAVKTETDKLTNELTTLTAALNQTKPTGPDEDDKNKIKKKRKEVDKLVSKNNSGTNNEENYKAAAKGIIEFNKSVDAMTTKYDGENMKKRYNYTEPEKYTGGLIWTSRTNRLGENYIDIPEVTGLPEKNKVIN